MEHNTSPGRERAADRTDRGAPGADVRTEVVSAAGELDWENSEDFADRLSAAASGTARLVIVDLSAVTVADSAVLHALLTAHRALERRGARLAVAGPLDPLVRRLFAMTGADAHLTLAESPEAARALADGE